MCSHATCIGTKWFISTLMWRSCLFDWFHWSSVVTTSNNKYLCGSSHLFLVLGISDRTRLAQTVARRLVWNATGDSSYVLWWKVTWHQTRFLVGGHGHKTALHPQSLSSRPWKTVVGTRSFPVGKVTFQGRAVELREGIWSGLTLRSWTHGQMLMLPASEPRIVTTVDVDFVKSSATGQFSKNHALHWPDKRYACWAFVLQTLSP